MAKQENGGMGHNSGALAFDSEDRRALFFTHVNPLWEVEKQLDELKAQKTKLKLQAKAEGFEAYEIDLAMKIRKTQKPETIDNQMARLMAVARYMNQPVGHQFNLLDEDRRPDVDRAYENGMMQALRGESLRNEYDQSLPQWQTQNEGYEDGQNQLRGAMQKRMEEANDREEEEAVRKAAGAGGEPAASKPRGRPKGSKNKGAKAANGNGAPPAPAEENADPHAAGKASDAEVFESDPFPAA